MSLRATAQKLSRLPLVDFYCLKECLPSMSPCITRNLGSVYKVGKDVSYWANKMNLNVQHFSIQLSRERLSEKMCTRQSRKVIWDMIDTLFLTTVAVEPTFVAFRQHLQTHFLGLSCQFFQISLKNSELKPPTMPFEVVACTFSDNLSQISCIFFLHLLGISI